MEFVSNFSQPLRLTYSLHSKTMMDSIQSCQRRLCYTDVQLIADGGVVFAHSIVLAAASNFLKQLLITNPDPTIVVHLPGVDYEPLRLLLEVLYGGEELQLTLKQVLALQNLGSLLHIDMCNSTAMEQAFLQASSEGVLTIPESMQQQSAPDGMSTLYPSTSFSDEGTPAPSPVPVQEPSSNKKNSARMSSTSAGKSQAVKKRKSAPSPGPVAPFSLLANVGTPPKASRTSRVENNDNEEMQDMEEDSEVVTIAPVQHKKPSRAAAKELVTCRECRKPFKLIMQLNQHMSREGHLFPPCPECATPFATLESLMAHADVHPPETVFTCKYCQKGVLGHDRYLYHMLMCKSLIRGDYVCFICRKAFRNSGSLKTHLLLHTGAKPFPCNYCSASFRQRHHRSHHERSVHLMQQQGLVELDASEGTETNNTNNSGSPAVDGSRPFPCGHCNASFRQSNHRSYHERVIHGVDRRTRHLPKTRTIPQQTTIAVGKTNGDGNGFTVLETEYVEPDDEEVEADENDNEPVDDPEIDPEMVEELEADVDWEEEAISPVADAEAEVDDEEVNEDNIAATPEEHSSPQNND